MILTNKEEQRKIVLHRRNLLSPHEIREKSKTIREKVFEMQEFENAQNIFTYISFGSEVRTQEIIEKCIEIGKKVFVPAIDSENKKIVAAEFDGFKNLKKTVLGVMEPAKVKEFLPEKLELVLVPG
ncbi:MAG: 5-formyltetrahydrofolate cyclo-ligase, partial [Candidatus Diapherotrites archaeon]|nr:5-formyltetrahydrofolate cyclo-ligase [Candidatus Diapherotrites archaeon]